MKKQIGFKTKGMNRDLSVSAFNPEFSFENRNLRLATNEGNTLMSWVNERGTASIDDISIDPRPWEEDRTEQEIALETLTQLIGTPIGVGTINHQLVVFTHADNAVKPDYIYVLWFTTDKSGLEGKIIYNGDLNLSIDNPLETLVSYEATNIQKVYWVDGRNQPRIINIAASKRELKRWNEGNVGTYFDFVPPMGLKEEVSIVSRNEDGGVFPPGVIQYCFTYVNSYSQQTNIFYTSPLLYLAHEDRAGSPDETSGIGTVFDITISNLDTSFPYIRAYSLIRTSLNSVPFVKMLKDVTITGDTCSFTDNGVSGSSIDPSELLYFGGKEIIANTISSKDGTLFLGNLAEKNDPVSSIQGYFDHIRVDEEINLISFENTNDKKIMHIDSAEGNVYSHTQSTKEDQYRITTYKGGEWYRFGLQFQKANGEWLEPVFINDAQNDKYPNTSVYREDAILVNAKAQIDLIALSSYMQAHGNTLDTKVLKRVRPVVVFPEITDTSVIAQGVLNPTVFNAADRKDGVAPYAQNSWFFRPNIPYYDELRKSTSNPYRSMIDDYYDQHWIDGNLYKYCIGWSFDHYRGLKDNGFSLGDFAEEVASTIMPAINNAVVFNYDTPFSEYQEYSFIEYPSGDKREYWVKSDHINFFVDQSIVTLNSPEYENDSFIDAYNSSLKLRIIGAVPITGFRRKLEGAVKNSEYGDKRYANDFKQSISNMSKFSSLKWLGQSGDTLPDDIFNGTPLIWSNTNLMESDATQEYNNTYHVAKLNDSFLSYSITTEYFSNKDISAINFNNIDSKFVSREDSESMNLVVLDKQNDDSLQDISYYGNCNKQYAYTRKIKSTSSASMFNYEATVSTVTPINFKSSAHSVIALKASTNDGPIPILPYSTNDNVGKYINPSNTTTFWGENKVFTQQGVDITKLFSRKALGLTIHEPLSYLWMGELYRDVDPDTLFGGKDRRALSANTWLPAGDAVNLEDENGNLLNSIELLWLYGDTYFQRYDCLKTYPFSEDDIVINREQLSFMVESRMNLDGRYDANRGEFNMLNINPVLNFNQFNPVYNQKNNYFNYKMSSVENEFKENKYPNYVWFSKTHQSGEDIDTFTNLNMASILELDGNKGEITAIRNFNNQLIAFQDSGISQILFNENVQVAATEGVPIEIANSGKVDGKRYLSNTIGCSNKWSIATTPMGLYFMDSINKDIYLFNGQLQNISQVGGFNSWCKANIPLSGNMWTPRFAKTDDISEFVTYYDKKNQDVLFINSDTALAWSEKLNAFTSFYDYGNTPFLCDLDGKSIWLRRDGSIWQHQAGEYCKFFDENKPYGITLVGNPEPQIDKIFTNLEFRACVEGDGEPNQNADKFAFYLPFDSLETWNEYQHGITQLQQRWGHSAAIHFGNDGISSLKRKFRIWRCDIPRDNYKYVSNSVIRRKQIEWEHKHGIYRHDSRVNDRMRNPWLYLKFQKDADTDKKVEIHDIVMTYFT